MLKELYVKNFAIIDDVNIKFSSGLDILTGETGAGKTLIIEAINLLIGERADLNLIRENEENLLVQGFFDFSKNEDVKKFLIKEGLIKNYNEAKDIEITRELNRNGRNRVFVNNIFTQVNVLKNLGKLFIDIHGQHDHQYLLDQKQHLEIIDRLGSEKLQELKNDYVIEFKNYLNEKKEIEDLIEKQKKKEMALKELNFKLDEIESLNLKEDEDVVLENEKNILKNYEKIYQYSTECLKLIEGDVETNFSLVNINSKLLKNLYELSKIDNNIPKFIESLEIYNSNIEELNRYLQNYINNFEFSPKKLEDIQERIFLINDIKRKYKMGIQELLEYKTKLSKQRIGLEDIDNTIELKLKDFEERKQILIKKAIDLHNYRLEVASKFQEDIKKELLDLNFKAVEFKVNFSYTSGEDALIDGKKIKFLLNGIDECEFLISTNPGESVKSLNKIASGGEISRVMLALKSIIGNSDNINTMIFDEIDAGIGGQTATVVGEKLYKISLFRQVICITHLPQIACFADNHLLVEKYIKDNKTKISIKKMVSEDKVDEIARMMSGITSNVSRLHSEELIGQCNKIKKLLKEAN